MTTKENRVQIHNLIKSANTYSASTDIPLILIDSKGDILYQTQIPGCELCVKARQYMGERLNCRHAHLYGSYQAERFGGKYVFFCQLGLTHWVSPVMLEDQEKGALIAGPVLMINSEDFLLDELLLQYLKPDQVEGLRQSLTTIPVISPDKVNELSNLLFIISAYNSGEGAGYLSESREILEQQSDISKYIHYLKTMGGLEEAVGSYPLDKEKELLAFISSGDESGARKILNEILGAILLKSGVSLDVVKARVLELVVVLSRAALEGGADIEQIFGLNFGYLSEIQKFKTIEEMTFWLSKIMGRFSECVFEMKAVKHADVIYKSISYIRRNYMKKITLEEVASAVYLSPNYFSKIFKDETGSNFITYLNQYRITVSKRLLMDDSIDLIDISSLVGYEDQSYFSKNFKKLTGITPGKFREGRGQMKTIK